MGSRSNAWRASATPIKISKYLYIELLAPILAGGCVLELRCFVMEVTENTNNKHLRVLKELGVLSMLSVLRVFGVLRVLRELKCWEC
jgi:hypothetical protein